MENILTLFTSEDKTEIKESIKELIINQVKVDLENSCNYLIDVSQIEDMISEIVEEVKDEVRDVYKEKLMAEIEERMKSII